MLNKVMIIGRIAEDVTLTKTTSGVSMVAFTIGCDRPKGQNQEKPTTDFVRIKAWNKTAEYLCQYCAKGDKVFIEGRLTVNSWKDRDGKQNYSTEIQVESWDIIRKKSTESAPSKQTTQVPEQPATSDEFNTGPLIDISSDDLPF